MAQRLDRAGRQHHHQREAHVGRAEILHHHGREAQRQALAAIFGRPGQRAPAALDIGAIGLPEARRHGHAVGRPFGADLVADPVQRRELARGELRRRRRRSRRPGRASPRRRRCRRPARRSRRCGGAGTSVLRRAACRSWEVRRTLRGWNGRYSARAVMRAKHPRPALRPGGDRRGGAADRATGSRSRCRPRRSTASPPTPPTARRSRASTRPRAGRASIR